MTTASNKPSSLDPLGNNPVPTLSALFDQAQANWRVFDIGRRIQSISKSDFVEIEANRKAYPFPLQQKARFALVFWQQSDKGKPEPEALVNPFIWFLQFDIDEMGLLKLQQRDHYISMVIKELGANFIADSELKGKQSELDNHPYTFTPDQNRLAAFNAKVKVALKRPASMYYEQAQAYFSGQLEQDNWQELTVQGIADYSARIGVMDNEKSLINILPNLTIQTLNVLSATLEHETISVALTEALIAEQNQALEGLDHERVLYLLRCLSGSKATGLVAKQLSALLNSGEQLEETLFIVIAGRLWPYLQDKTLLHLFFERVAEHKNQLLFAGLFEDLVMMPELRVQVLSLLRDSSRPEAISRAIGRMFNGQQNQ